MEIITNKTRKKLEKGLKHEVKEMTGPEREAYLEKTADYILLLDKTFNERDASYLVH